MQQLLLPYTEAVDYLSGWGEFKTLIENSSHILRFQKDSPTNLAAFEIFLS